MNILGKALSLIVGSNERRAPAHDVKAGAMVEFHGIRCVVENPRGSVRMGVDPDGHEWETKMPFHYGYIVLAEGVDGDKLDCCIGPDAGSTKVFVVHQRSPVSGNTEELKIMFGYRTEKAARAAFRAAYDHPGFLGAVEAFSLPEFKAKWLGERMAAWPKPVQNGPMLKNPTNRVEGPRRCAGDARMVAPYLGHTKPVCVQPAKRSEALAKAGPLDKTRLVLRASEKDPTVRRWMKMIGDGTPGLHKRTGIATDTRGTEFAYTHYSVCDETGRLVESNYADNMGFGYKAKTLDELKALMGRHGQAGGRPAPWDMRAADLGTVYHGGSRKVTKPSLSMTGQRDYGYYGKVFYVSQRRDYAATYGNVVSTITLNPDAKVLDTVADERWALWAKGAHPALVERVVEWRRKEGGERAAARGKTAEFEAELDAIRTDALAWKDAVDAYARANGYDIVRYSRGEIVCITDNAFAHPVAGGSGAPPRKTGQDAGPSPDDAPKPRLAPNGKPSRLNAWQYEQVRTPQFKAWFGDWEAADLQRRIMETPEHVITGNEIPGTGTPREIKERAIAYYTRHGMPEQVVNRAIQQPIKILPSGIDTSLQHGFGPEKVAAVAVLDKLVESAAFVVRDTERMRPGVVAVETFANRVRIGGKSYIARIVVRQVQDGRRFYDHELSELMPLESARLGSSGGSSGAFAASSPSRPLPSLGKRVLHAALSVNPESVSKVVDENGEPRVVYHGTAAEQPFTQFEAGKGGLGYTEVTGEGFYFTDNPERAWSYAEGGQPREGTRMLDWSGRYQRILPVFLSMRNPLIVDGQGKGWREIMGGVAERARASGHDGFIVRNVRDPGSGMVTLATRAAGYKDYTGPFATDYTATTFCAFDRRQAKSAYGNDSSYSPVNPDLTKALRGPIDRTRLVLVPSRKAPAVRRWQKRSGEMAVNWVRPVQDLTGLPPVLYHGSRNLSALLERGVYARRATDIEAAGGYFTWDTPAPEWAAKQGMSNIQWGPKVWAWFQGLTPEGRALFEAQAGRKVKDMEDLRQTVALYWTARDPDMAMTFGEGDEIAALDPRKVSMYGWFEAHAAGEGEIVLVMPREGPQAAPSALRAVGIAQESVDAERERAGGLSSDDERKRIDAPAAEYPEGDCFKNALTWASKHYGPDVRVVHGTVERGGKRFPHAWVEMAPHAPNTEPVVVDPTAGVAMTAREYSLEAGARWEKKFTAEQATVNMVRAGTPGPWTDEEIGTRYTDRLRSRNVLVVRERNPGYPAPRNRQVETVEAIRGEHFADVRANARRFYEAWMKTGSPAPVFGQGARVIADEEGWNHLLVARRGDEERAARLRLLPAAKAIIEAATYYRREPPRKENGKWVRYWKLTAPVRSRGDLGERIVSVIVKERHEGGRRFYSVFEVKPEGVLIRKGFGGQTSTNPSGVVGAALLPTREGPLPIRTVSRGRPLVKSISFDDETSLILENAKKPENRKRHRFQAAKWTHKNGHPRCILCGEEESVTGYCKDLRKALVVRQSTLDALNKGQMAMFPGMVLAPAPADPTVRRWQQTRPRGNRPAPRESQGEVPFPLRVYVVKNQWEQAWHLVDENHATVPYGVEEQPIFRSAEKARQWADARGIKVEGQVISNYPGFPLSPPLVPWQVPLAEFKESVLMGRNDFKLLDNTDRWASDAAHALHNARRSRTNVEIEEAALDAIVRRHHAAEVTLALARHEAIPADVMAEYPALAQDAFCRWFGRSVVRTPDGKPLRVYHGTRVAFHAFDLKNANSEALYGPGFYFTDSARAAGGVNERLEAAGPQDVEAMTGHAYWNAAGYAWQGAQWELDRPLTNKDMAKAKR